MRVLLATDGSEDARAATAWLTQFPLPAGSELRVVSAVSIPIPALDVPPVQEFQKSLMDEAQRVAEAARAALAPRFQAAEAHVGEGDARDAERFERGQHRARGGDRRHAGLAFDVPDQLVRRTGHRTHRAVVGDEVDTAGRELAHPHVQVGEQRAETVFLGMAMDRHAREVNRDAVGRDAIELGLGYGVHGRRDHADLGTPA